MVRLGMFYAALALLLDQLSKWLILEVVELPVRQQIPVAPFFDLAMVWNRGVSFGMFAEHNQPYALVALALAITAVLLRWLWKTQEKWEAVALGLVIGGALGNVIDRLRFGAVADFLDFYIKNLHWPAFNIADSAVCIGVVVLCARSIFVRHEPKT